MLGALALFAGGSAAIAALWNRFFPRVPWRMVALLWAFCALYQAETLFTAKVDLPARLAFHAYPWKATGLEGASANTGIVFSQLAPWTRNARDQLLAGHMPLWNRNSASGAPLLANQQTAIFHPFTLLGLPLSVGKAFTLSASLRLFTVLFFMFVLLRGWGMGDGAALFGAVAYAFCTFHIVWLLFPLGLATMMLPVALAGAQQMRPSPSPLPASGERVAGGRVRGFVLLVLALSLSVLGGHPESALWVWITVAAYVLVQRERVVLAGVAFAIAMLLTAFFWYPTLRALQSTARYQTFQSAEENPADHGLSYEWLLTLVAPNVLGTPQEGTYTPPRGAHPAVLNDYGEVASSYAGLFTLALALSAPFVARGRHVWFALGLMLFALLTIAEVPLWRDVIRAIPLAGISIHQRLRILWNLGACIAAASAMGARPRTLPLLSIAIVFVAVYSFHTPEMTPLAIVQFATPLVALALSVWKPNAAIALVFVDLVVATWRYNPPSQPDEVYPVTGAIRFLQQTEKPYRMAALGWSFLPETPGYYGLEDIKATDPVQHFAYMFLLRGYLETSGYDQILGNVERPYFDFLNVRWLYVPPDHDARPAGFVERYRGADGVVLENLEVLPRYYLVRRADIEPDLGASIFKSRAITDFREQVMVDRGPQSEFAGGGVRVVAYEPGRTLLDVGSRGVNLLVTSDVHWPGWQAWWNGERKEVVTVNGAFVGVFVPQGRGRLELRYRPREFEHGLYAGIAGLVLLVYFTKRSSRSSSSR